MFETDIIANFLFIFLSPFAIQYNRIFRNDHYGSQMNSLLETPFLKMPHTECGETSIRVLGKVYN